MRDVGRTRSIILVVVAATILFLGRQAPAQKETTASVDQRVVAMNTAGAPGSLPDQTTAPVFVPSEVQDVGGQWIVPEESDGEMAVRKATSTPAVTQETPEPPAVTQKPLESSSAPPSEETKKKGLASATEKDEGEKVAPRFKEDVPRTTLEEENEQQAGEVAPPRPSPIKVVGTVKSVKPVGRNELEVTVKTRDRGEVKVLISPLQVTRVPGTGRRIHVRGYVIREGRSGTTIRAMEVNSADDGVLLAPPPGVVPAPVVVMGEWCW